MPRSYDDAIRAHYDSVAAEYGASSQSTMGDDIVRGKETLAILDFVDAVVRAWRQPGAGTAGRDGDHGIVVADVGCGNGYTLQCLGRHAPQHRYVGIEHNDELRRIATKQAGDRARVIGGDIRDLASIVIEPQSVDILICQRVLINILDLDDQRRALTNLVALAKPGAALLVIESFRSGLDNLNAARAEFGLDPIPPAIHNLPLPDDFFERSDLARIDFIEPGLPENLLSTHFYVSRILHELALRSTGTTFQRNSHFVRFMSAALPDAIGHYSPLRVVTRVKRAAPLIRPVDAGAEGPGPA